MLVGWVLELGVVISNNEHFIKKTLKQKKTLWEDLTSCLHEHWVAVFERTVVGCFHTIMTHTRYAVWG